ncbi:hypothetical protein ASE01_04335 [Nocardioides sp. Root190]|uniref:hypothetical protein n=1 Tax=Nocardioides sp. Root190 TaxID=1736488 RepID=UPI0006FE9062|nr:hypothetical protein [Nocardioides sp. Root190]KRB78497.1 hypothetical protein ASE01_04335 [Nocardioides sp. Root190]
MGARARHDRPATRPFGVSVERGLRLAIGILLLARTVDFAFQFVTTGATEEVAVGFGAIVVICTAAVAIRCLAGTPSGFDVVLCTLALVAGALSPRSEVPLAGAADSPVVHLIEPMLLVIAVRRRQAVVPILALAALHVALRWTTGDLEGLRFGVQEAVFATGTAFGALFLVTQMRRASARAETVIAGQRAARDEQMSAAEVTSTAFLHDELIPTLLSMDSIPDAPQTRTAAKAALARITGPDATDDTTDIVGSIRAVGVREDLDLEVVVSGPRTPVPDAVLDALVGATAEALRNVARHSGQRRATVSVVRRPTGLRITIEDPGKGFNGTPGVGMRVAIMGRVEAVGATARIGAAPGNGTVVSLVWRARWAARVLGIAPDHDRLIRAAVLVPGRIARQACGVLAVGYLGTAVLIGLDAPQPASYAGAAAITVLVLAVTMAMSRGPMPPLLLGAIAAVPAVVLWFALPTLSREGIGGVESWLIEFSALPALAIAWVVSVRAVLAVLVPNAVVILVAARDLGIAGSDLPHLLLSQPATALFVAVIVSVCRRAGSVMSEPVGTQDSARTKTLEDSLAATLEPVVAALRAASEPGGARDHAPRELALAVRDCLYLPGPNHAPLRAELDELRRVGTRVVTILPDPPSASRTLATSIGTLRFHSPAQVTLSANIEEATLVVVPGLTEDQTALIKRALPVAWKVEGDEDASILTGPTDLATLIRRGGRRHVPG